MFAFSRISRSLLPLIMLTTGACTVGRVAVADLHASPPQEGTRTTAHVRAHLVDGSTVVFRHGASFERGRIRGVGERWALGAFAPVRAREVTMDSVVAMEAFHRHIHRKRTMLANVPTAYALLVAIVGAYGMRGYRAP